MVQDRDQQPDLLTLAAGPHLTPEQRRKLLEKPCSPKQRGHYHMPGTGPEGETCGTCKHCVAIQMAKRFYKCELNSAKWTHGYATDIRKRDQACKYWNGENDA